MAGHRLDDAGALVDVLGGGRRVADWSLNGHWGLHAGASVDLFTKTWQGLKGHTYLVTGALSGEGPMANKAAERRYWAKIGGAEVWATMAGVWTDGSYGSRLGQQVIPILATHTAAADGEVTLVVGMDRLRAIDQDWELVDALHTLDVVDLGGLA